MKQQYKKNLCPQCLSIYKHSKEGKLAQKQKKQGSINVSWGKDCWPFTVYHDGSKRLCPEHNRRNTEKVTMSYSDRVGPLSILGFSGYKEYLKSDLWSAIREHVFAVFGRTCHYCESEATQVHHAKYDTATLSGLTIKNLIPVCEICHHDGEFHSDGSKSTPSVATERMRRHGCERGFSKHVRKMEKLREDFQNQTSPRVRPFDGAVSLQLESINADS